MNYQMSLLLALVAGASAAELRFLGNQLPSPQRSILSELEDELGVDGRKATEARLSILEGALSATFAALPKNAQGNLGAPSARYALHRLFVQRHGWQVKGLQPRGEAWDALSPASALGDRVPAKVRSLFEDRLGTRGLDLHELAVMAAMLENMSHSEAEVRLAATFRALGQPEGKRLNQSEAIQAIDAYMANYVMGTEISADALGPRQIIEKYTTVEQSLPNWPETQAFLRQVQHDVAPNSKTFSFAEVSQVIAEVSERYGQFQNAECTALQDQMVNLEEHNGTGRIRLGDFYHRALRGENWQFSESVAYLRQSGALDESEPSALRVIIPNYILSPSNCLASSSYYAVCCINQCESLFDSLERELAAPTAAPEQIFKLVEALPSGSANRTLASALRRHLVEVADHHGGQVPLHGRLFAQWMHHAFPRECPYPHVSGTTNPLPSDHFEATTGQQVGATQEEMYQHVEAARVTRRQPPAHEDGMCSQMWTMEEELVDPEGHRVLQANKSQRPGHGEQSILGAICMVAAVVSTLLTMARMLRPVLGCDQGSEKVDKASAAPVVAKVYSV